jgi:hypothetical protein
MLDMTIPISQSALPEVSPVGEAGHAGYGPYGPYNQSTNPT